MTTLDIFDDLMSACLHCGGAPEIVLIEETMTGQYKAIKCTQCTFITHSHITDSEEGMKELTRRWNNGTPTLVSGSNGLWSMHDYYRLFANELPSAPCR
jgi:hypothetical protein